MQKKINKIEDFADEFLQSYYTSNYSGSNLLIRKGEKTKRGIKVDTLVTFKHPKGALFTAALNTAHSNRLATLLTNYKKNGLSKLRYLTALMLLAATSYLLSTTIHWALAVASGFFVAIAGFVLHTALEKQALKKKISSIVHAVQGHYANELWLGISVSSLNFRSNTLASYFLALCEEKGIGIMTVGQRGKVVTMQKPQTVQANQNDFLSEYVQGDKIREIFTNPKLKVA